MTLNLKLKTVDLENRDTINSYYQQLHLTQTAFKCLQYNNIVEIKPM